MTDEQRPPSPAEVLEDLKLLSQREGLLYETMSKATRLPWTLVVTNELAARPDGADRLMVAYNVVRCVASSTKLLGPKHSRLVSVLLNCDQSHATTITQRRDDLALELKIGADSLERAERIAFSQLAGTLVSLKHSPCGGEAVPEQEAEARARTNWELEAGTEARRLMLAAFGLLRLSKTDEEARRHAREILEQIPAGTAYFQGALRDPRAILQRILERIVRREYDTWAAVAPPSQVLLRRRHLLTYLETFGHTTVNVEAEAFTKIREQLVDLRTFRDLGGPEAALGQWQFQSPRLVLHKFMDSSLELLVRIAVALEVTDNWTSIDDPEDGAEIAEPAPVLA